MRVKHYPITIWFLDDDLCLSALSLSNRYLNKTAIACFNALVSARLYCIGVRNKKAYQYWFSKEHVLETMDKHFPLWPFSLKPKMLSYGTRASKWCRKCFENYQYTKQYLSELLNEQAYRYHKDSVLQKFIEWDAFDAPLLKLGKANCKVVLPWKCLDPRCRMKDIVQGYRKQYRMKVKSPFDEYNGTPRDIPSWLIPGMMNVDVCL